jgi:hypothetical protein
MLQIADSGLYVSKQIGRDRITIGQLDVEAFVSSLAHDDHGQAPPPLTRRPARPVLHDAADEEDPRPTGLEIR